MGTERNARPIFGYRQLVRRSVPESVLRSPTAFVFIPLFGILFLFASVAYLRDSMKYYWRRARTRNTTK